MRSSPLARPSIHPIFLPLLQVNGMSVMQQLGHGFKPPSLAALRLRPYGDSLATPSVSMWLGFARIIILLMAGIEGIVWGLVGASIVPEATPWLRPIAGLFMFALMFSVIWIVDASLIMSERPVRATERRSARRLDSTSGQGRWLFGLVMRVLIVAISLYVTAPFLAKLIRADDIEQYHQRLVERYYAERDATFQSQVAARVAETEARDQWLIRALEAEIARLGQSLTAERERRDRIEAEYAPEIQVLRAELAAAQERVGDEVHGRGDRVAGYGPEARRWEGRGKTLVDALAAKQAEIDARIAAVARAIVELEEDLRARTDELQGLRLEQAERLDVIRAEVAALQPEELPPRLTFAARSKALQALRESPDEAGVPHFETVDGFAQAALAILFFSLIALKLFEPASVRAYFNESVQIHHRKYLAGGLAEIPGFEPPSDPSGWLNPVEFARLWQHYEADPDAYLAAKQARLMALEPLVIDQAERELTRITLERRRENLEEELTLARQRREIDLATYAKEQQIRAEELRIQLADETRARQHHRRAELDLELQRARDSWVIYKAQEEEALLQRKATFEQASEQAIVDRQQDAQESENAHRERIEQLRQSALTMAHRQRVELTELETRHAREAREERRAQLHDELARLRGLDDELRESLHAQRESCDRMMQQIAALAEQIEDSDQRYRAARHRCDELTERLATPPVLSAPASSSGVRGFWGRADDRKAVRELERERQSQERQMQEDEERLTRLREERRLLELRRMASKDQLRETEQQIAAIQTRILLHEDTLANLLSRPFDSNPIASAPGLDSRATPRSEASTQDRHHLETHDHV